MLLNDLEKKHVLVTGASRGIGQAVAESFLEQGAYVYGVARSLSALNDIKKNTVAKEYDHFNLIPADLYLTQDIQKIADQLSQIDILIHNAAFFDCKLIEDISQENWNKHIQVNLTAPFLLTKLLWEKLKKTQDKESTIVFVSSLAGVQNKEKFPGNISLYR